MALYQCADATCETTGTLLGGPGAPDDMDQAHLTQVWLAAGDDPKAQVTGKYSTI